MKLCVCFPIEFHSIPFIPRQVWIILQITDRAFFSRVNFYSFLEWCTHPELVDLPVKRLKLKVSFKTVQRPLKTFRQNCNYIENVPKKWLTKFVSVDFCIALFLLCAIEPCADCVCFWKYCINRNESVCANKMEYYKHIGCFRCSCNQYRDSSMCPFDQTVVNCCVEMVQ